MRQQRLALVTVLLICLISNACTPLTHWRWEQGTTGSSWPLAGGDAGGTRSLSASRFDGRFDTVWVRTLGDKPLAPLTIQDAALVYPSSKKLLRQFNLATGEELAQFRVPGELTATPVRFGHELFVAVGGRANKVIAYPDDSPLPDWATPLADPGRGLVFCDTVLLASSGTGRVIAVQVSDGDSLWSRHFSRPIRAELLSAGKSVIVCLDNGEIHAISTANGRDLWVQKLNSPVTATPSLGNSLMIFTVAGEGIALNPNDGAVRWRRVVTGAVWGGGAIADTICITGSGANDGELVALSMTDGHDLWRRNLHGVVRASPVILGDIVVAGTLRGWLYAMKRSDGMPLDSVHLDGGIEQSPISDGERVYVASSRGNVAALGVLFGSQSAQPRRAASAERQ